MSSQEGRMPSHEAEESQDKGKLPESQELEKSVSACQATTNPRTVVGAALGLLLLTLILIYTLSLRRNATTGPEVCLATVLFAISALLWITQNLSEVAARKLDTVIQRSLPWTEDISLKVAGISAIVLAVLGVLAPLVYLLIHREVWSAIMSRVSFGLVCQLEIACILIGGILLKIWVNIIAGRFFHDDYEEPLPLWKAWLYWLVIAILLGPGPFEYWLAFVLGGSLVIYAMFRLTRWILLSPVVLGAMATKLVKGPSLTLGFIWVMTLLATVLVFYGLVREY